MIDNKMELPFAVAAVSTETITPPTANSASVQRSVPSTHRPATIYDNVRLCYFTPSGEAAHIHAHTDLTITASKRSNHCDDDDEEEEGGDDEDFYVAVEEDSFVSLSTQDRSSHRHFHPTYAAPDTPASTTVSPERGHEDQRFDVLTLLLDSSATDASAAGSIVSICDEALHKAAAAYQSTRIGELSSSVLHHLQAARLFREAALRVKYPQGQPHPSTVSTNLSYPATLVYNLLLLCQTHAQNAQSLLKCGAVVLDDELVQSYWKMIASQDCPFDSSINKKDTHIHTQIIPEDRLRATIRASMDRKKEVDMTESAFLGPVISPSSRPVHTDTIMEPSTSDIQLHNNIQLTQEEDTLLISSSHPKYTTVSNNQNPIDDMIKLEKELRDMDMSIELGAGVGNSIASLTDMSRGHYSPKNPDISYCLLPSPNLGASYMTSSSMWASTSIQKSTPASSPPTHNTNVSNPIIQGRARADRVKSSIQKAHPVTPSVAQHANIQTHSNNLDASWWGHASILASSTVSLGNSMVGINKSSSQLPHHGAVTLNSSSIMTPSTSKAEGDPTSSSTPITTKQLLRLLDTIRTLGDENSSLLRQVENAQKAQMEAKATREAMKVFQEEYGKRFSSLKVALEQYRRENNHPMMHGSVVEGSQSSSDTSIELKQRDKIIEKLNAELQQEKEDGKKKDNALRKYENFYKEVKARSAQKAKQREDEQKNKNYKS